jgi:Spy/CpxP family protein refolding chaperone
MTKRVVVAAGLVVFGSWAALAAAQPEAVGPREPRSGEVRERTHRPDGAALERQLGLSDEQAEQLRRLRADERKQAIRRRADLAIARLDLDEALDAPTVDEKLVATRVRAVSDLQAAEVRARADRRLAVRKVLTPEQQEKLRQLMREGRVDRAGGWRGRGARRGPSADAGAPEGPRGPRDDAASDPPEPVR